MNKSYFAILVLSLITTGVEKGEAHDEKPDHDLRYTFSFNLLDRPNMKPRGGTTQGIDVTLAERPEDQWSSLQKPGGSNFERDRKAILAMTGEYRVAFEFIETVVFKNNYEIARPYQSWGTEYVFVLADDENFISLQHILVMRMVGEDKTEYPPIVMKHWRQDWEYEDRFISEYRGNHRWVTKSLEKSDIQGTWSQAVFHVDDSPRYESTGKWTHAGKVSQWTSELTSRPLPRREHTVRNDYDILIGRNRHTITPEGWIHEQDNRKIILSNNKDKPDQKWDIGSEVLAFEIGVNRYDLIEGFDFSDGHDYWKKTSLFWSNVRDTWSTLLSSGGVELGDEYESRVLNKLFRYASDLADSSNKIKPTEPLNPDKLIRSEIQQIPQ